MTDDPDPRARKPRAAAGAVHLTKILSPRGKGATGNADATLEIDIAEPCAHWRSHLPNIEQLCDEAARAALAGAGVELDAPAELSIVLGDDAMLGALNKRWRGQNKPTNVLSFPALAASAPPGAPRLLGDVVLAFETISAEAMAQAKPLAHHLRHLVVHGVLHLLGFDHGTAAEAERMETLETELLARLGVPDPYHLSEASHG
jgi:probable rRNA maturation factor